MGETKKSKEEWLSFIHRQIQSEEQKRKKYGITLWILIGATGISLEKLINYLFSIDSTAQNTSAIFSMTGITLIIVISLFNMAFHEKVNREPVVLNIRKKDNVYGLASILTTLKTSTLIMILLLILLKELILKNWIISLYILLNYLSNLCWFICSYVPVEPSLFMDKITFSDKLTIKIYSGVIWYRAINILSIFLLINNIIKSFSLFAYTREIIMVSLLINIIFVLILIIYFLAISYDKDNYYETLEKEIFLSDMDVFCIEEIVFKHILGESSVEWIIDYYKYIEKACEDLKQYQDNYKLEKDKIDELILVANDAIVISDGLMKYFDKRWNFISYIERNYYNNNYKQFNDNVTYLKEFNEKFVTKDFNLGSSQ